MIAPKKCYKVKAISAVMLAFVILANLTALSFASDYSVEDFNVAWLYVTASVTYEGDSTSASVINLSNSISTIFDSDTGFLDIHITRPSSVAYIYGFSIYFPFKNVNGSNSAQYFYNLSANVFLKFNSSVSGSSVFILPQNSDLNWNQQKSLVPAFFSLANANNSSVLLYSVVGLNLNGLTSSQFLSWSGDEVRGYPLLLIGGFGAFAYDSFDIFVKLYANDTIVNLADASSDLSNHLSTFDPLIDELQSVVPLPTYDPGVFSSAEAVADDYLSPSNFGIRFSFMESPLAYLIFVLVAYFTVLSIILFGHSGG